MQGFFHVGFFLPSTVRPSLLRKPLRDRRLAIPRQGSKKRQESRLVTGIATAQNTQTRSSAIKGFLRISEATDERQTAVGKKNDMKNTKPKTDEARASRHRQLLNPRMAYLVTLAKDEKNNRKVLAKAMMTDEEFVNTKNPTKETMWTRETP